MVKKLYFLYLRIISGTLSHNLLCTRPDNTDDGSDMAGHLLRFFISKSAFS